MERRHVHLMTTPTSQKASTMMVTGTTNHIQKDSTSMRSAVTRSPSARPPMAAGAMTALMTKPRPVLMDIPKMTADPALRIASASTADHH
jgi:hypothetical protein